MSTWAENRRADKAAAAEQRRADLAVIAEQRRADENARAERERADQAAAAKLRQERADAARDRRAKFAKAATGWVSAHTVDLLFVPVILVPALLAWSAIAGFGHDLYGAPGWTMPLYSEAAMWAFAFALAAARRAVPARPVRRLLVGLWFSAVVSATLAFLHGVTADGGSVTDGVVMAIVAVGGVVVHQLVDTAANARPRRTREQRAAARLQRLAAKRVHEVRRAALRQAAADLAADGSATLVHTPGLVRLRRGRLGLGRARLVPTTVPGLPVTAAGEGIGEVLADEIGEYIAGLAALPPAAPRGGAPSRDGGADTPGSTGVEIDAHPSGKAETGSAPDAVKIARYTGRTRAAIDAGRLPERPSQAEVRRFLRCRAEDAAAVHRALFPSHDHGPDDDDPRQEVTA